MQGWRGQLLYIMIHKIHLLHINEITKKSPQSCKANEKENFIIKLKHWTVNYTCLQSFKNTFNHSLAIKVISQILLDFQQIIIIYGRGNIVYYN